jgi:uncharacterized protein (UPF0276 family)
MAAFPSLGVGHGWRPGLARFIEEAAGRGDLGFVEVLAEHIDPRALPRPLVALRDSGVPIIVHGLALSLGGRRRPDRRRLRHLAACADALGAPVVSEHLGFVRTCRCHSDQFLPVPRTRAALDVVCRNIAAAQARLPVPLALENIATPIDWPGAELSEAEFVGEVAARTGVSLLLDLANLYANARNRGMDPVTVLDDLPLDRLAYVHVAGGVERDGVYRDTHRHAVPSDVLALVGEVCARTTPPGVLIEWDGCFPPEAQLAVEIRSVRKVTVR